MTGHFRLAALLALTATLASAALVKVNAAGGAAVPTPVIPVSARTFHYTCHQNQKVSVTYLHHGAEGPTFAVLDWNGVKTGLAEAVSASGARYAALNSADDRGGLEWWEHQGTASLNAFVGGGTLKTRPLLSGCKVD